MPKAILLVGPRGAGKTTYIEKVIERHPEVKIVSQDKIALKLFNRVVFKDNFKELASVAKKVSEEINTQIKASQDPTVIIDCWNNSSSHRQQYISYLRYIGTEEVIAWYFITPLEICLEWFMNKPDQEKEELDNLFCTFDYYNHHKAALNIQEDGFNKVIFINPCKDIPIGSSYL